LPPDVPEWLPENHLAWFVIDVVGVMETTAFYAAIATMATAARPTSRQR
jgi:hypothetical protein